MSNLPLLPDITTSYRKGTWDDDEIYYKIIFFVYCATYCCGISIQHLIPKEDIHPIITSLMRFHVYFTIRRILRRLDGNEKMSHISAKFSASEIYRNGDHIKRRIIYNDRERKIKEMFPWETYDSINNRGSLYIAKFNKEPQYILFSDSIKEDYKRYIPVKSNGSTKIGIQ